MTTPYNTSTPSAGSALQTLALQAATPVNGVPLVNGTPNILTWTAPNDGKNHRAYVFASMHVGSAMTGGQIELFWTEPGGTAVGWNIIPPAAGAGYNFGWTQNPPIILGPGQTVFVTQSTALTVGAATLWAEIWGS